MRLSPHFTLEEFTRSEIAMRKGLDNTPPEKVMDTLKRTAEGMEAVREVLGTPIHVNSAYRAPAVNMEIGGAPSSQHLKGEAVDFVSPGFGPPREVCKAIRDSDIAFDQLIYEGGWVHISFRESPRRSVLTARFANGKAHYSQGIA